MSSDEIEADETTKPKIENGTTTFVTMSVNKYLCCSLCSGYFRNPYTITECLHTFCHACLLKEFRKKGGDKKCPECGVGVNLSSETSMMADRSLQELIEKIFPKIIRDEEATEAAFYSQRGIKRKQVYEIKEDNKGKDEKKKGEKGEKKKPISHLEDEINFQLLPLPDSSLSSADLSLPKLGKPYLRTSGRLKVLQIKKYLNKKIGEVVPNVHVQLFCQNTLLGNELSLTFLKKTRWRNNETDLILHYRKSKNEENE
ncbi:hypothetical protein TrLO_g1450 [Triparma laevis f. longispina]|uniref:RING-type domain-containing protein n=1 Tax=Triparma laevis f. longispina TaxID=1714387 RepID=A0A9W7B070_9STRA|nr:hypothetical protein TrLO_g1450 [Triparma laevis f. longispina]